jgi:purine-binding chemotaxis protein CheW
MREHRPEAGENGPSQHVKLAFLRVASGYYALDIMCIREIIRPLPLTPVPKAPAYVDGIITLRNTVIPVVDLRRRFDLPVTEQDSRLRMIICAVAGRMIALLVNEVTEIRTCDREEIQPAPYYLSGENARFFPGVCRYGERLYILLDLKKILDSDQVIDGAQLHRPGLTAGSGGGGIAHDC